MSTAYKHDRHHHDPLPHAADLAGVTPHADADDDELQRFQSIYRDAAYYSTGRDWTDYAPAYRYGREAFEQHRDARFEQIEPALAQEWEQARSPSRLAWAEARGAVLDAWQCAQSRQSHRHAAGR